MITTEVGFRQTLDVLSLLSVALKSIRVEHPNIHPTWYAVMSEGFVDHIEQARQELEEYANSQVEDQFGELGEVDLARRTMTLRPGRGVAEVPCLFTEQLAEAVQQACGQQVKVSGIRSHRPGESGAPLHV